jgi:hypothetical protein
MSTPEESPDYDVSDGLPEDQEEDEEEQQIILKCYCGATLEMMVGSRDDIPVVAKASRWKIMNPFGDNYWCRCPRCK